MTTALLEPDTAPTPIPGSACARDAELAAARHVLPDDGVQPNPTGAREVALTAARDAALAALAVLPLRERVSMLHDAAAGVFEHVHASVVDWGDDPELCADVSTVDEKLASLQGERRALVEVTVGLVRVGRSLDAWGRVVADQHARVVSRFDADQLGRRLSSPATALAGEFACDDYAPILGISAATAARWAESGSVLRARHPRLLALAAAGRVRMRA